MFFISRDIHIGYNLFKDFSCIHRHSQIYLLSKLKENNLGDCHPPVLVTIYLNEGLSQNELSKILHFNKGAIAKLVKSLEENGYIKRLADENDRRAHRLYLTDKGKQVIPILFSFEEDWANKAVDGLTDKELNTLNQLLHKIIDNFMRKEQDN